MKTYLLKKEIVIAAPIEQVWKFFSDPANLEKITPPYMNFRVTKQPGAEEIHSGMLIEYKVSPVLHIPMKWVTLIQTADPLKRFTDKQLKGPYALWEHTHTFERVPGGTLMRDAVTYALPFSVLGAFAHWLFVRKQLEGIFSYREKVIKDIFD